MPNRVHFHDSEARSLWIEPSSRGCVLQVQDGPWFSDRFLCTHMQLEALATGMVHGFELGSSEGEAALRFRWSGPMLICEYEGEDRGWREEVDMVSLMGAIG